MSSGADFDNIKRYLPQYLSIDAQSDLFHELRQFPENIDERMYAQSHNQIAEILQGDGIKDLLVVVLPKTDAKKLPCIIVSNSCDIQHRSGRFDSIRMLYAPIMKLERYEDSLRAKSSKSPEAIAQHITEIRSQRTSNTFYLPTGAALDYEAFVRLDAIQNGPPDQIDHEEIAERRLFSLSNYGFYLFLFKISIHFTRIRESHDRGRIAL